MKYLFASFALFFLVHSALGQQIVTIEGKCNNEVGWSFDGQTLNLYKTTIQKQIVEMPDYNMEENLAPWLKRNLSIRKVFIGEGISNIGSCAFANCKELEHVEFFNELYLYEIGWGAFLHCNSLFNFSIPQNVRKIGKIAFADCSSLRSAIIPPKCRVEDYAFMSCTNLNILDIATNAVLGKSVFVNEVNDGNMVGHTFYHGEVKGLPANVNEVNCYIYGLSKDVVTEYLNKLRITNFNEDVATSTVDTDLPSSQITRNDTYALVIGNQHYRFAPDVPYALHDARTFAQYCKTTLGLPVEHVHICEDATKAMILEQEIEDWMKKEITSKDNKKMIIYYAGHGVPDVKENNKAYILPTDVYGTTPKRGISLDYFYTTIGNMGFQQVTIFMDACFSGVNRNNVFVNEGLRGVEVDAEDTEPSTGNMVIFCAAQGNETAQAYQEEGHGLFTYYLLKEIKDNAGELTLGQLARSLEVNVSRKAHTLELRKKQVPETKVSSAIGEQWKNISF